MRCGCEWRLFQSKWRGGGITSCFTNESVFLFQISWRRPFLAVQQLAVYLVLKRRELNLDVIPGEGHDMGLKWRTFCNRGDHFFVKQTSVKSLVTSWWRINLGNCDGTLTYIIIIIIIITWKKKPIELSYNQPVLWLSYFCLERNLGNDDDDSSVQGAVLYHRQISICHPQFHWRSLAQLKKKTEYLSSVYSLLQKFLLRPSAC